MIYLNTLVHSDFIAFLDESDKKAALDTLIDLMDTSPNILDKDVFREAIFERESIVSTGIGLGIAIPHVKIKEVRDLTLCVGISKDGIDWNAIDNQPVHVVFLIAGSDEQHEVYLRILAKIVLLLKNRKRREKLIQARTIEEVVALFEYI